MRRRRHSQHQSGVSINLTPMIDMVFILLIFLLLQLPLLRNLGLKLIAPRQKQP